MNIVLLQADIEVSASDDELVPVTILIAVTQSSFIT